MATYQQELSNFQQQWNLPEYDLHRVAANIQALRFADSFLKGAPSDNSPTTQYEKWFAQTLAIYFEANIQPNERGKYLSSFDAKAFYRSFRNLVQAKYDADAEEKEEEPLQVTDVTQGQKEKLEGIIAQAKRKFQKTLPNLWQEKLKAGALKIETLQTATENAYASFGEDRMLDYNVEELDDRLTTLVAAHEAMKQLRESRKGFFGWIWKVILNRGQNRQEKAYLQELNEAIDSLRGRYNVDEKVAKLTGKTVFGKDLTDKKTAQETQPQEVKTVKTEVKPLMEPIKEKTSALVTNASIKGKVIDTLKEKMPVDSTGDFMFGLTVQSTGGKIISDKIQPMNEDFDKGVAKGNDPKKEMGHVVRKIFVEAMKTMGRMTSYTDSKVKVEAMKIFTKEVSMNFTAVAVNPELGSVVDSYVELNANRYEKMVSEGKDFFDEMDTFEQNLEHGLISEEEPVEQVFGGDNNPFTEKDGPKSPQVSQASKQNVPTINNSNN